jgi:ubiquinone/menaquinone biosynthesis C-methylase UbiE
MRAHVHGNCPAIFEGRASRFYDFVARRLLRGVYGRIVDDLVDIVPENGDVLDVGTGPGVLLVELASRRPDLRLTGIDLSSDMIAAAERNLRAFDERASARMGDVTDLPFADDSFDVVVTSFSAHHWDHPAAAIPELDRVLRRGGNLYVYDFSHGPFRILTDTARERGLFAGRPVRYTEIHTGVPLLRRCIRLSMTTA